MNPKCHFQVQIKMLQTVSQGRVMYTQAGLEKRRKELEIFKRKEKKIRIRRELFKKDSADSCALKDGMRNRGLHSMLDPRKESSHIVDYYYYATAASLKGMRYLYPVLSTGETVPAVTLPGFAFGPGAVPARGGGGAPRRFPPQPLCSLVTVAH